MAVHFEAEYLPALAGLVVGALIGYVLATSTHRASTWDTRVTLPLVLAAGAAHLALIPTSRRSVSCCSGSISPP